MLYFEDFVSGTRKRLGSVTLSAEDIIEFASEYDPQPMHTDETAARQSMFGGLVASGWQGCCLIMRLFYDGFLHEVASLGGPGIQETKFLKPVRPGDTLTLEVSFGDKRVSKSRPTMGFVGVHYELLNQHGACVTSMDNVIMISRRDSEAVG